MRKYVKNLFLNIGHTNKKITGWKTKSQVQLECRPWLDQEGKAVVLFSDIDLLPQYVETQKCSNQSSSSVPNERGTG